MSDITIVITNYKRPNFVLEAAESCAAAQMPNVIISASGEDEELRLAHAQIKQKWPKVIINSIKEDRGCNEMWLRGVKLVKTPWVHILHDDDRLLPEFKKVEELILNGSDLYTWDGAKHGAFATGLYTTFPGSASGVKNCTLLFEFLLNRGANSLSPVAGLFRTEHAIQALEEAERMFKREPFLLRPTMMVGNDLILWLRAAEKYPRFYYYNKPLVSYGHHPGSVSYDDATQNRGKLKPVYNATRDYFLRGFPGSKKSFMRVWSRYTPHNLDEFERVKHAYEMWKKVPGQWSQLMLEDSKMPRLFEDRARKVPYLKDIIDIAMKVKSPDVRVITNADIIPVLSITNHLSQCLDSCGACYSFRVEVPEMRGLTEEEVILKGSAYSGVDLFALTPEWWAKNRNDFPDMLFATEAWDYLMRIFIEERGGKMFQFLTYHVVHTQESIRNAGSPAQLYNRALATDFLKARGIKPYWLLDHPVLLTPNMPHPKY